MANRLQFRRGSNAPSNIFYEGEPIYDKSNKVLYVGDNGGTGAGAGSSIGSNQTYLASLEMLYKSSSAGSGSIRFYEDTDNGTEYVKLQAPASLSSTYTLTLPSDDGDANQVLKTDGSGALSWATMAVNSFTTINVSGQSTVSADQSGDTLTFENGNGIFITTNEGTDTITIGIDTTGTATFSNINVTGVGTIATLNSTTGTVTNLSGTNVNYTGVGTITTLNSTTGTVTNLSGTNVNYTGVGTITTLNSTTGTVTNLSGTNVNYTGIGTVGVLDVVSLTQNRVVYVGAGGTLTDSSNLSFNGTTFTVGTGVGITQFTNTVSAANSSTSVPTSEAIIAYITSFDMDDDLSIAGDTGTGTINLDSQSLTVAGTANETQTSVSGQTVTVGLTSDVTIRRNLTVNGDLTVYGSTTAFETEVVKVEDRVIELGLVGGGTTASSTWDLGVVFNYGSGGAAKKAGVFWLGNEFIGVASSITTPIVGDTGTGYDNPDVQVVNYAPIVANALYFGGTTSGNGGNEVLAYDSGTGGGKAVNLIFDGGVYA